MTQMAWMDDKDWPAMCNRQETIRQNDPFALALIARVRARKLHFYDGEALGWFV